MFCGQILPKTDCFREKLGARTDFNTIDSFKPGIKG